MSSSSNSPNEPSDNPFEFSVGSDPDDSNQGRLGADPAEDEQLQMPPIKASFWIGSVTLVALGMIGFFNLGGFFNPNGLRLIPILFSLILRSAMWMSLGVPFAVIRLVAHRGYIARAIRNGTYPGNQRFGLWYLIQSIIFTYLCLLGGGMLFMGLCTAYAASGTTYSYRGLWDYQLGVAGGILSLCFAGFLFVLGIPKYR